jgi:hypothetical protein
MKLHGKRVMIYNGIDQEGAATIKSVVIPPRIVSILPDQTRIYEAYCMVKFDNDRTNGTYPRWVSTANLLDIKL